MLHALIRLSVWEVTILPGRSNYTNIYLEIV